MLGRNKQTTLPKYDSPLTMASVMNIFFINKIDSIRAEFPLLEANLPSYPFLSIDYIMSICTTTLYHFDRVTDPELLKTIPGMNKTTCSETALLRVYNDIVTTVGKGNGSFLVLLDLSAAFDTIDHDNLFYILEKYSEMAVLHYG